MCWVSKLLVYIELYNQHYEVQIGDFLSSSVKTYSTDKSDKSPDMNKYRIDSMVQSLPLALHNYLPDIKFPVI